MADWVKRPTGWGTNEYVATIDGRRYCARKTGGRFLSWEVRIDQRGGERITSGSKLRSVIEGTEAKLAREAKA